MMFEVQDGDSGNWRKLEVNIVSDPRRYFSLRTFENTDKGVHRAQLLTTTNLIDREDPSTRDGFYTIQIKVCPY